MTITAHRATTGIVLLIVLSCAGGTSQSAEAPVAIVSGLTGTASVRVPAERTTTPLRLFQWLPAGSVVEVARGSTLTLVFANGVRYELGPAARATAGRSSLTSRSGPVRHLEAVPPLPRVWPIAGGDRAGGRSGAVRIRGATIAHLYPDGDAATLADTTVLRFAPVPDASHYRVEVETETGASVFEVETRLPTVVVPPRLLKPGAEYYWEVRTLDRIGQVARGAAAFVTLSADTAAARAVFNQSLEADGDASSLALLAEIDRSLGLLVEAVDKFRAAVVRAPADGALRQALEQLEQQLAADRGYSEK